MNSFDELKFGINNGVLKAYNENINFFRRNGMDGTLSKFMKILVSEVIPRENSVL